MVFCSEDFLHKMNSFVDLALPSRETTEPAKSCKMNVAVTFPFTLSTI